MVVHAFNPNTEKAEAGESLWVEGLPSLHSEFHTGQGCIVRPCLKHVYVHVLVWVSISVAKHHGQKQLGVEGFASVYNTQVTPHPWRKSGQKHGNRSWCRGWGRVLLMGLFPIVRLACRTTHSGVAPPQWMDRSLFRKCAIDFPLDQFGGDIFSSEIPPPQIALTVSN